MPQSDKYVDVDWAFGRRLRELREARGVTIAQMAALSGVSKRTIQLLEAGTQRRPRRNTLALLAVAAGVTLEALLSPLRDGNPGTAQRASFRSLEQLARRIDAYLIALVRDHRHVALDLLLEEHRDLVRSRLLDAGLSLEDFLNLLEAPTNLRDLCSSLPNPDLVLTVAPEFEWTHFETREHLVRVDRPLLLWDCHCKTPGTHVGPEECPIHSQPGGNVVTDAMTNGHVEIRWRDVRVRWERDIALWPPAVDSFAMLNDLRQSKILNGRCRRLIDLGSGTGFLAAALVNLHESLTRVVIADWLLSPLLYSAVNCALNFRSTRQIRLSVRLELLGEPRPTSRVGLDRADLAICNPPYLPLLPGFESLGQHSAVAGTDLLKYVIQQASRLARATVVQFSHLAAPEAALAAGEARLRLVPLGEEREVPFRVVHALQECGYIAALCRERQLITRQSHRHVYWHRLRSYAVVPTHGVKE